MEKLNTLDNGRNIDWGRTSADYARYRPGPPNSLYEVLKPLGIGIRGQEVLDQGTGTGVFARQLALQGCKVTCTDISAEQIAMAIELAKQQGLETTFQVAAAEKQPFDDHTFDAITASQCHMYFDQLKWPAEAKRLLRKEGKILFTYFSWLPEQDPISKLSETLVLKHNPDWGAHSWDGKVEQFLPWMEQDFRQSALIVFDEPIPFTLEVWRGRWRALRGIGATLNAQKVDTFDREHEECMREKFGDNFIVPHRVVTRIFENK